MEILTDKVQIPNQDLLISAYLAQPQLQDQEQANAIVVVQEIFGVNEHIQDVTRRFAEQGYIAIAPAIYQRQAPDFMADYTPEDVKIGRVYKNQTKAEELLGDIQATIDYLYKLPQVKKTGVGAIGFCFGGHVTYLTATLSDIKATASFYGAGIANWCPSMENKATIDYTKDIQNKIHCFFGLEDASIPVEQVEQIEAELKKYNIDYQIDRYANAGHGFFCDRRGSYHQPSAKDAWLKVLALFQNTL